MDRDYHGRFLPGHFQSKETNKKIGLALMGRVVSEETRKKISLVKSGIRRIKLKRCPTCKKKFRPQKSRIKYCSLSCSRKGKPSWNKGIKGVCKKNSGSFKKGQFAREKHPNWKGGITPLNRIIRESEEYKQWRKLVYERDNYTCLFCGKKGNGKNLNADHIKPFAYFPNLRFDVNNGRTLCVKCHRKTLTYAGRYNVVFRTRDNMGRFI